VVRLVHPTECEGSKSLLERASQDARNQKPENLTTTRMSTDSDTIVLYVVERIGPTGGGPACITRCEQAGAGWGGRVVTGRG
jgi:hypothetical protein